MGYDDQRARGSLRFTLGHTTTRADVDAVLDDIGPVVERAHVRGSAERGKEQLMRVLAAMSGGVDSAVAAARMAEAGHDVVGVHLALSREPAVVPQWRPRLLHASRTPATPAAPRT